MTRSKAAAVTGEVSDAFIAMRLLVLLAAVCILAGSPVILAQKITLVPPTKKYPASDKAIEKYANRPEWRVEVPVRTEGGRMAPELIRLIVPSPFAGGYSLGNSVLPVVPQSSIVITTFCATSVSLRVR